MVSALVNNQTVTIPLTIDNIPQTAKSNIGNGFYNVNKLVSLLMSEKGAIYYTLDWNNTYYNKYKIYRANNNKFFKDIEIFSSGSSWE
jgi:hypothetical protein